MQLSDIPVRFAQPFAYLCDPSDIRQVPLAPTTAGLASLEAGFPPECFQPVGSGGVPPSGADFNGLLFQLSGWARWIAAGAPAVYNSAFQTLIGGYPNGALVQSATLQGLYWLSTADNNTTDPEGVSSAGWQSVFLGGKTQIISVAGSFVTDPAAQVIGLQRAGATSTTLPAGFDGQTITYEDLSSNFNAFPHTVTGNFPGGLSTFVANVNKQSVTFRFYKDQNLWSIRQ